jgi:hypothetical protein
MRAILIEREPEYQNDIRRRMKSRLGDGIWHYPQGF